MEAERQVEESLEVKPVDAQDRAKLNLWQKLARIRENVRSIPKRGFNAHFNYYFVQASDVYDVIGTWMGQLGVVMVPAEVVVLSERELETRGGRSSVLAVQFTWEFINADKPEERQRFVSLGEGEDRGDKRSYKATTGAEKYALISAFQVPTGLDPEREGQEAPTGGGKGQGKEKSQGKPSGPAAASTQGGPRAVTEGQRGGQARSPAPSEPRQAVRGQAPHASGPAGQQDPALDFGRFRGKPLRQYTDEDLAEACVMTREAVRRAGGPQARGAAGFLKALGQIEDEAKLRKLPLPRDNSAHVSAA